MLVAVLVPIAAVAVAAIVLVSARPSLAASPTQIATITLPAGAGSVERLTAVGGVEQKVIPVVLHGDTVSVVGTVPQGERVTVIATVKRPGWISWLTGARREVRITVTTPTARLRDQYITVRSGEALHLHFAEPVAAVSYGTAGAALTHAALARPSDVVSVPTSAPAGTMVVVAAARSWETPRATSVTWFPAGAHSSAVASPAPGAEITAQQPITLTFQKTVRDVLGAAMPAVSPSGSGTWETVSDHVIRFVPTGYGYGLGARVTVSLPSGVQLVGASSSGSDALGEWTVKAGSTLRLQQLLAELGYLPVSFHQTGTPVASTIAAQESAASDPPAGSFSWRWSNTPSSLQALWQPGVSNEIVKGAVMSFEDDAGLTPDGVAGPAVWKALIGAAAKDDVSTFGYTYVYVSEGSPETESTWHNGKTVVSGPVNTGVSGAATATGVFAVFEHLRTTTMSGTNVDGSKYVDPGIPYVSYFNGGDALHGYIRASYGFPQSNGCVEMPYAEAGQVWPYTPVGTIVNVTS